MLTDSGNLIYDIALRRDRRPRGLARRCSRALTGVVEHGLFLGLAERALIGTVRRRRHPPSLNQGAPPWPNTTSTSSSSARARAACGRRGWRRSPAPASAVAEEHRVGGTCVIRGCIPKKFMVYAWSSRSHFKAAEGFGWTVGKPTFDWPAFLERQRHRDRPALRASMSPTCRTPAPNWLTAAPNCSTPTPSPWSAKDQTYTADKILIATGGRPYMPQDLPGIELAITSNEAFHLERAAQAHRDRRRRLYRGRVRRHLQRPGRGDDPGLSRGQHPARLRQRRPRPPRRRDGAARDQGHSRAASTPRWRRPPAAFVSRFERPRRHRKRRGDVRHRPGAHTARPGAGERRASS